MRTPVAWLAGPVAGVPLVTCASPSGPRACQTVDAACLPGPASMTGIITQVTYRPGSGTPRSSGSYDLRLAVEPSAVVNAAVIVDAGVPVFVRVGAAPRLASSGAALQPGDKVEVVRGSSSMPGIATGPCDRSGRPALGSAAAQAITASAPLPDWLPGSTLVETIPPPSRRPP